MFVVGYLKGGLNQLFGLAALFCAFFLASPIGMVLYKKLISSYAYFFMLPVFTIAAGILIYLIVKLIGKILESVILGSKAMLASNKVLGACLGGAKAVLVIIALIFMFDLIFKLMPLPSVQAKMQNSFVVKNLIKVNPAGKLEFIPKLLNADQGIKEKIANLKFKEMDLPDYDFGQYVDFNEMQEKVTNSTLVQWMKDFRLKALYENKQIREILNIETN